MKSRAPVALAFSLVCTFAWTLAAPSADAAVLTVGPSQKIQDAIDLLLINSDPIDTIRVAPGTYAESIVIDFSGTNQTGLTIVRLQSQRPLVTGGFRIQDAFRVTLSGLRIDSQHGDQLAAVRIIDSTAVAIDGCSGIPGDDGGVDAVGSFEVVVLDSEFVGMHETGGQGGFGVRIVGGSAHFLNDVEAAANDVLGFWIEADEVEMSKLDASGNGGGSDTGGILIDGLGNSLKSSEVKGNDGFGLQIIGTCDVKKCTINGNDGAGIRVGESGGTTMTGGSIRSCTVKNNGSNGIVVREEHRGLVIANNKIAESSGSGVRLVGDGNHVTDNTIKNSKSGSDGGHGVFVTSSSSRNSIDQNVFGGNSGAGVRVEGDDTFVLANLGKGGDAFLDAGTGNSGRANVTSGNNDFP